MDRIKIVGGASDRMEKLATCITDKYTREKYLVQTMRFAEKDGMLVQITNAGDDVLGTTKKILGCSTCASLLLFPQGDDLRIEVVQGRWLDKGIVIAFGTFVACGILTFTGLFGVCRQISLLNSVFHDAEVFAAHG